MNHVSPSIEDGACSSRVGEEPLGVPNQPCPPHCNLPHYKFSDLNARRMIGNAHPPHFAKIMSEAHREHLEEVRKKCNELAHAFRFFQSSAPPPDVAPNAWHRKEGTSPLSNVLEVPGHMVQVHLVSGGLSAAPYSKELRGGPLDVFVAAEVRAHAPPDSDCFHAVRYFGSLTWQRHWRRVLKLFSKGKGKGIPSHFSSLNWDEARVDVLAAGAWEESEETPPQPSQLRDREELRNMRLEGECIEHAHM